MSIDLNWETLTTKPDGLELAEEIREFIHTKFQTVALPRFLKTIKVHAFEFGSIAPQIELKDICDPLPDFYEETEENQEAEDDEGHGQSPSPPPTLRERRERHRLERQESFGAQLSDLPTTLETRLPPMRSVHQQGDVATPSSFLGVNTPGIPGGTSNLSYFHSQLASGLSGTSTPLAAVAGAHLPHGWPDHTYMPYPTEPNHHHTFSASSTSPPPTRDTFSKEQALRERASVSTLPSITTTRPQTRDGLLEETSEESASPRRFREPRVEDLQTVFRVKYSGDIKLSLTAEILLDYPMPSFVGIPVKLNITGLSFDGVAVLAYIRKRAHFCFLSPDDAEAAIGTEEEHDGSQDSHGMRMGGLLHEIKVESEIGQKENGKQVLKNVGKVEKFVLEQVRRIFEDEFVYPSFWTFLV